MDTVILVFSGAHVYIGDVYQGKIKKIPFKSQDYWEVYDKEDLRDLLEYMNYPMNYNRFKGSHVRILYTKDITYQYVYGLKTHFEAAESFGIHSLEAMVTLVAQSKGWLEEDQIIECLEQKYHVHTVPSVVLELDEDLEEEVVTNSITIEDLCTLIVEDTETRSALVGQLDVGAPIKKGLQAFLENSWALKVGDVLCNEIVFCSTYVVRELPANMKKLEMVTVFAEAPGQLDGQAIAKGDGVIAYKQLKKGLMGKVQEHIVYTKAQMDGTYFVLWRDGEQQYKAVKNEVLGVITAQEKDVKGVLNWLGSIGMYKICLVAQTKGD